MAIILLILDDVKEITQKTCDNYYHRDKCLLCMKKTDDFRWLNSRCF